MAGSLHIDHTQTQALIDELHALAESAQQGLTQLRTTLREEGACWGDDEPGRMIGEVYEPEAERGLDGYETLIENLRGLGRGLARATETFDAVDDAGAREVAAVPLGEPAPHLRDQQMRSPAVAEEPAGVVRQREPEGDPAPAGAASRTAAPSRDGSAASRNPFTAGSASDPEGTSIAADPSGRSNIPPDTPMARDGAAAPEVPAGPETGMPTGAGRPFADGSPFGGTVAPASQSGTPVRGPVAPASGIPPGRSPADPVVVPAGRRAVDPPWARQTGIAPGPRSSPWAPARSAPPPASVLPPVRGDRPPRRDPESPPRREKGKKKRRATARPEPVVDIAAVTAVREMAARHGLIVTGFDAHPAAPDTVRQLVAAVDDILGRHPFLRLTGIEITELAGGSATRPAWERTGAEGAPTAAWILLDRDALADPAVLAERVPKAPAEPLYSAVVTDLGRIVLAAAGPAPCRLAQRSLIDEYRRISGPWNGDTLAAVVAGYRRWRELLGETGGPFQPEGALVSAFAEVEVRGDAACGPARVLHRLLVEFARQRSLG
ncbi:WXG100 family type VII secretion target [Nocardia sp. X0981]